MENLIKEQLGTYTADYQNLQQSVDKLKEQTGCTQVWVCKIYSKARLFPIFNDGQIEFMKSIFETDDYSRFDGSIVAVLESKESDLKELHRLYDIYSDEL
jgi:hypothetical protein